MIRQAISCDLCGAEMLHPNHWFAASDQGPELRVSTWDKRSRLRPGAKHLCGQTCLHKLVDEFTARSLNQRIAPVPERPPAEARNPHVVAPRANFDAAPSRSRPAQGVPVIGAAYIDENSDLESSAPLLTPLDSPSRGGRAEAWKRERQRQTGSSRAMSRSIA